ncbi:MAG: hypothetical protein ACREU4_04525 [Burkholderiales bacterium]
MRSFYNSAVRTPDERFASLPGFPYAPHYLEWRGLRAHYVDEGNGARTFLCLHGEPTWAYLYRAGVRRFPQLVPDNPDAPGAAVSRKARDWWKSSWQGEAFMAIGAQDPVLGPPVMHALRKVIRNCPEPYVHAEGGHFLQEWGEDVAAKALASWR